MVVLSACSCPITRTGAPLRRLVITRDWYKVARTCIHPWRRLGDTPNAVRLLARRGQHKGMAVVWERLKDAELPFKLAGCGTCTQQYDY